MTHYQKLATMIFRIVGVIFVIIGALVGALALPFVLGGPGILIVLFYSLPTLAFGVLCFTLSKRLAAWVCVDFDDFSS